MPFYVSIGRSSISSVSTNASPYHYASPDGNSVWKGPRKICCFCTLAIVFPALLISVPLLMRFVLYGTSQHFLSPSDMKILDQRISTTWCQAETVRINTSFTVYVTDGEPSVIDTPTLLTIDRNLIIPDDHKEYWGFYLLKGSRFKIRTCSRWKGGTLLVVQGRNHLEHCAYIGEADSAGDSDQVSSSNSIEVLNNEIMRVGNHKTHSQEEMSNILSKIRHYIKSHPRNYGRLKKNLADWMLIDEEELKARQNSIQNETGRNSDITTNSPVEVLKTLLNANSTRNGLGNVADISILKKASHEILEAILKESGNNHNHIVKINRTLPTLPSDLLESIETGTIKRSRRQTEIRRNTESGENGAFEDDTPEDVGENGHNETIQLTEVIHPRMKYLTTTRTQTPSPLWAKEHGHHTGILNDTYDPNDGSDSESESSFSSSEEALLKCEGVVASFNLSPDENCGAEGSFDDLDLNISKHSLYVPSSSGSLYSLPFYEDTVNASGYYYFIFGSENEKRDNFIRAKFELEKLEYQLPEPVHNCTNVRECHIGFKFASSQKVVVRIPQPPPHVGDSWDQVFIAETECHPRTHLYMIFALMVPVVILLCAFQ